MSNRPVIALVMGSTSDLPQADQAFEVMKELKIPHTVRILSAHRTPDQAVEFARTAQDQGLKIIIAIAGAAAHLGGVLAAHTPLPVIGVPIAATSLAGLDALLSTVQMPGGVPVATMGIGASGIKNAAIFAGRILAMEDKVLADRIATMTRNQAEKVLKRDEETRGNHTWTGEE